MKDENGCGANVRSNNWLGVLALPEHIGLEQGPDDCPKLTLNGTVVATFPAGSWREVANALCSIVGPSLDEVERLRIDRDNARLLVSEGNVAIVELGENVEELEAEIERLRAEVMRYAEALVDVLDGTPDHHIEDYTALSEADCERIAKARADAVRLLTPNT